MLGEHIVKHNFEVISSGLIIKNDDDEVSLQLPKHEVVAAHIVAEWLNSRRK
jgi:hypothetical protein